MYSANYAKEIGLRAGEKIVPLKFALPLLAAFFAAVWFGLVAPSAAKSSDKIAAASSTSGQMVATR